MSSSIDSTERAVLLAYLRSQREHVLKTLERLSEEDLRKAVLPSGWNCLGMIQHLALDVERCWFRAVVAGEQVDLKSGDDAWQVPANTPAEAVIDLYRREAALADEIIRS